MLCMFSLKYHMVTSKRSTVTSNTATSTAQEVCVGSRLQEDFLKSCTEPLYHKFPVLHFCKCSPQCIDFCNGRKGKWSPSLSDSAQYIFSWVSIMLNFLFYRYLRIHTCTHIYTHLFTYVYSSIYHIIMFFSLESKQPSCLQLSGNRKLYIGNVQTAG